MAAEIETPVEGEGLGILVCPARIGAGVGRRGRCRGDGHMEWHRTIAEAVNGGQNILHASNRFLRPSTFYSGANAGFAP
jgi:hypothetical protein